MAEEAPVRGKTNAKTVMARLTNRICARCALMFVNKRQFERHQHMHENYDDAVVRLERERIILREKNYKLVKEIKDVVRELASVKLKVKELKSGIHADTRSKIAPFWE